MRTVFLLAGIAIALLSMPASVQGLPCTDSGDCPQGYVCEDGACVEETTPEPGDPCEEGTICPTGTECINGICDFPVPQDCSVARPCPYPGQECIEGECHFITPGCTEGEPCDDDDACTTGDTCSEGECQGTPRVCDDGNPCTDDVCDSAEGCVYTNDDTNSCADADACNGEETCVSGACQLGTPIDCNDLDICTSDTCINNACQHSDIPNCCTDDGDCNDGDACTSDTCINNACQHSAIAGCCTDDGDCDDGIACNGVETCVLGVCQPGTPVVCDAPCFKCVEPDGCVEVDLPPGNPHTICDGVCVNTQNNDEFCGGCEPCPPGFKCKQDVCVEVPKKK